MAMIVMPFFRLLPTLLDLLLVNRFDSGKIIPQMTLPIMFLLGTDVSIHTYTQDVYRPTHILRCT